MKTPALVCGGLVLIGVLGASMSSAVDAPIPVRLYLNRTGSKTKFVARGPFILPDATSDNPVDLGGDITFGSGTTSETLTLPAANWTALGNPPGSQGFTYTDSSGATCRKLRVTSASIKGLCKATSAGAAPYDPSSAPPITIVLAIGSSPQRYCGECPNGGVQKGNPQHITKFKECLAPAACPGGPVPTPTQTPASAGVCCDFATGCSSAPSSIACLKIASGTGVGGGAVCDASGGCVPPPGLAGGCCEGVMIFSFCTMVDQSTCEGGGGTFHPSAVCAPNAVCIE